MALLAVLNHGDPSWNGNYAQIEFHSYNERYEGSYPNLYFCFDVQARIVAINSGWWMIQANTTFNYGGVQQTHGIYTGKVYGTSDWYFVGSHRKPCGCGRSFKFEDGCSVSGYPNLSGRGSITSPTIEAPAFTARAENIDQRTCDIVWDTTDNPYNMYRMYVKYPDGHYSSQLPMDGSYSLEGLNSNTSYTYRIEAWQADGRGSVVAAEDVTFKTLENYPEVSVTEVTYEIEDAGETDTITFRFKSTDDSHVSKWYYQIQGGPPFSGTSPTYTESRLAKNLESYIDVWTEDTLGRTSSKFRQYFHTTFTKMTVWRRMKTNGYQLFDASKMADRSQGGAILKNNGDGSFTISGNGVLSSDFYVSYVLKDVEAKALFKQGTLSLLGNIRKGIYFEVSISFTNGSPNKYLNDGSITLSENDITYLKQINFTFYGRKGSSIPNETCKPMVYQDGNGTWEPYTGGKPFDGYLRGFMYCIQSMLWGYARPYILNSGRKWLNALPYDIVRRFVFSGKTNAAGLEVHKIYGNTVQETTKGINLANYNSKGNNVNVGDVKTGKKYTFFFNQNYKSGFNLRIVVSGQQYELELDKKDISALARAVFTADRDGALYYNGYTNASNSKNFMLVEGDVYDNVSSIQYEPYTGGKPAPNGDYPMEIKNVIISEFRTTNRNIIDIGDGTKTISGVTFTPQSDGSILVNGTATAQVFYGKINRLKLKDCIVSGCPSGGSGQTYSLITSYYKSDGTWINERYEVGNGYLIDSLNADFDLVQFGILIRKGTVCNNLLFKPMVEFGSVPTTYVQHKESIIKSNISLAKDDVYKKGTILRKRKKIVLDGSSDEGWKNFIANTRVQCQLDTVIRANYLVNGYCNMAVYRKTGDFNKLQNNEFTIISLKDFGGTRLIIRIPSDISTLEEWKTWLSTHNLVVEYELATPTTEYVTIPTITSFDPYTNAWTDSEVETQIEWRPAASSTLTERFYAVEQYRKVINKNT